MYENYEVRKRLSRRALFLRASLVLVFLLSFGFAGGVLFLLIFMVPIEQWLVEGGTSQGAIDALLSALTIGWIVFGLLAAAFYARLFLRRRKLLAATGISCVCAAAACVTFFFLLDTDAMLLTGRLGQETTENERVTFGSYPDAPRMEELKEQGYDGIITLLNPAIPFENVLLEEEQQNGEDVGIPVYSYPMLPWVSENAESLEEIRQLVGQGDRRFYIHCYLGKHRVDLVQRELSSATRETNAIEEEPLPSSLERGSLLSYDEERIVLGPYPTDDEWLDIVLRRNVKEVISTLNPENPEDLLLIEKERQIAEENGITFTSAPLDPDSPEPNAVQEIASYAQGSERKVYIHEFRDTNRFGALESALQEITDED